MQLTVERRAKAKRLVVPAEPSAKELSERELAVLRAVSQALDNGTRTDVYISFVRRFRAGRIVKHGGLETCKVRLKFGFRCFKTDRNGTAEAIVDLRRFFVSDSEELAHNYFVWAPYELELIVRGDVYVVSGRYYSKATLGNTQLSWKEHIWFRSGGE